MSLKFLHLSDIHFRKASDFDLDKDLRNEIEEDLKRIIPKTGHLDAILVGGDVAFSGKNEEYEVAYEWLRKVCGLIGCLEENVLTVPGNHDVERDKICPILQEVQGAFKALRSRPAIDGK